MPPSVFSSFLQNRKIHFKCKIAGDVPIWVTGNSGDQKLGSNVEEKIVKSLFLGQSQLRFWGA